MKSDSQAQIPFRITSPNNYIKIENYPGFMITISDSILGKSIFPTFKFSFLDEEGIFVELNNFYIGLPVTLEVEFSSVVDLINKPIVKQLLDLSADLIVESNKISQTKEVKGSIANYRNVFLTYKTKYSNFDLAKPSLPNPTSATGYSKKNLLSFFKEIADKYLPSSTNKLIIDPKLASKFGIFNKLNRLDFDYIKDLCKHITDESDFYVAFMNYRGDIYIGSLSFLIQTNSITKKTLVQATGMHETKDVYQSLALKSDRDFFSIINMIFKINSSLKKHSIKKIFSSMYTFPSSPNKSFDTPYIGVYFEDFTKFLTNSSLYDFLPENLIDVLWKQNTVGLFMPLNPYIKAGDVITLEVPKKDRFRETPLKKNSVISGDYLVLESHHTLDYNLSMPSSHTSLILTRTSNYNTIKDKLIKVNLV